MSVVVATRNHVDEEHSEGNKHGRQNFSTRKEMVGSSHFGGLWSFQSCAAHCMLVIQKYIRILYSYLLCFHFHPQFELSLSPLRQNIEGK
jgi:hypothetical protein